MTATLFNGAMLKPGFNQIDHNHNLHEWRAAQRAAIAASQRRRKKAMTQVKPPGTGVTVVPVADGMTEGSRRLLKEMFDVIDTAAGDMADVLGFVDKAEIGRHVMSINARLMNASVLAERFLFMNNLRSATEMRGEAKGISHDSEAVVEDSETVRLEVDHKKDCNRTLFPGVWTVCSCGVEKLLDAVDGVETEDKLPPNPQVITLGYDPTTMTFTAEAFGTPAEED